VYDCLYPHTIGGFERFYRDLAERLARHHEVTYLTRRQWSRAELPNRPVGVRLIAFSCGRELYTTSGRRRVLPPICFGIAVLAHLVRNLHRYDVVQSCSFPYFPMLSCGVVRALGGPPVVTDWIEIWSNAYWRRYLGAVGGSIALAVQKACIRLTRGAVTHSKLVADALRASGYQGSLTLLEGHLAVPAPSASESARAPIFVYAGRHIPEKHVDAIPVAIALARERIPNLRAEILGDGPERCKVLAEIKRLHLEDVIQCPGFVQWQQLDSLLLRAMGLILPSEREGYGMVVMEAIARGTPAIVVASPDNAAVNLIEDNVNGFVADSASAVSLAEQIIRVHAASPGLQSRTLNWYREHAATLSLDASVVQIEAVYRKMCALESAEEPC